MTWKNTKSDDPVRHAMSAKGLKNKPMKEAWANYEKEQAWKQALGTHQYKTPAPKPKDERNLYGGQYRFSKKLADEINTNAKYFKNSKYYVHDMSAFEHINHFDLQELLIRNNINAKKLKEINAQTENGNPKRWNNGEREKLLLEGVVKLGKKYKVPLEKPNYIDARGNVALFVSQKK